MVMEKAFEKVRLSLQDMLDRGDSTQDRSFDLFKHILDSDDKLARYTMSQLRIESGEEFIKDFISEHGFELLVAVIATGNVYLLNRVCVESYLKDVNETIPMHKTSKTGERIHGEFHVRNISAKDFQAINILYDRGLYTVEELSRMFDTTVEVIAKVVKPKSYQKGR